MPPNALRQLQQLNGEKYREKLHVRPGLVLFFTVLSILHILYGVSTLPDQTQVCVRDNARNWYCEVGEQAENLVRGSQFNHYINEGQSNRMRLAVSAIGSSAALNLFFYMLMTVAPSCVCSLP